MSTITIPSTGASISGLAFLWLEITGKCNLTCSHCYAESGPHGPVFGRMRYEEWARVISEAAEYGCRQVQFIGGEPTMHPDLHSLIALARREGFTSVEVFTNATRLAGDVLRCFREYNVDVASSFYSDDPGIHSQITGSPESWQRTIEGFQSVLQAGLQFRVGVIAMAQNAGRLEQTTRFLNSLGIKRVRVDRLRRVGRGGLKMRGKPVGEFNELCGQCWKGRLCVAHSGDVFPCVFARAFPMGDIRDGLAVILESARLLHFRRRLREHPHSEVSAHDCGPNPCNPEFGCEPAFCVPDGAGCTPNDPSECGPDK